MTVAEVDPFGAGPRVMARLALPLTLIVWGESVASSVSVIVAARWPDASGAKVTLIEQFELTA